VKILVAYYSETGNTAQIASAIHRQAEAQGHETHLQPVGDLAASALNAYDLVFLGSACHHADLARPVKQLLDQIPDAPAFKLAGFATHSAPLPEGGEWHRQHYERWASRCVQSFQQASHEKDIDLLGYFGCQGAASPPIEHFIHSTIVTDEDEWQQYVHELRQHPNGGDLQRAAEFAREVLARF
jgi:flavodoxin